MFCRLLVLFPIALAEFSCQKKAAGPPPRYAVVRFENLSGDPSLDWAGRAASEILPVSLAGAMDGPVLNAEALKRLAPALGARPAAAPGISSERAEALLAGATRIFSGYVERAGGTIRVVTTEEDARTGKSLLVTPAEDPSFLGAVLDYLAGDEPLLLAFASRQGWAPADVVRARDALGRRSPDDA